MCVSRRIEEFFCAKGAAANPGHTASRQSACLLFLGGRSRRLSEIVVRTYGEDALIAAHEQHPFEQAAALVVKKIFGPVALDEFRNHDDNASLRLLRVQLDDLLTNWDADESG